MWKISFFVLIAGCLLAYTLGYHKIEPSARTHQRLTIMATIIVAGILAIAASARRWNRR